MCDEFTECLRTEHGFNAEAPYTGASYDLIAGEWLTEGNRKKKERRSVNKRNQGVFDRLIAAGKRLMTVIQHNEGGAIRIWQNLLTRLMRCATSGTDNKL